MDQKNDESNLQNIQNTTRIEACMQREYKSEIRKQTKKNETAENALGFKSKPDNQIDRCYKESADGKERLRNTDKMGRNITKTN